jgi:multiple sugar transport system permease protein
VRGQEPDVRSLAPDAKGGVRAKWRSVRHAGFGYVLLAPALLIILGLNLYPTLSGIATAFTNQSLLNPDQWAYVGFENFQKLFKDPVFRISLIHSLVLTGLAVFLQVVLGLILAHLLIQQVPGIHFFRSIGMIAWVLPIIASVVMFRFITLPNYGFVNIVLTDLGLGRWARNWFGDETYAFLLILIMHLWRNVPFYAISFMAAMQSISAELYEAARIDGASTWRQFCHITLPNLRYIILVMVVLHVTFTFNNFDFVYLSTGGGPVNSTEVLPTYIYKQAWNGYALGYASAGGVIMLIVLVLLAFGCKKLIGGFSEE